MEIRSESMSIISTHNGPRVWCQLADTPVTLLTCASLLEQAGSLVSRPHPRREVWLQYDIPPNPRVA